jgi:anti-sigma regulatory factor (Ser/Thr protein kinase)
MEHGTNFDPNEYVEIGCIWSKRAVTLRVKDPGQGFSLDNLRHAAVNRKHLFDHLAVREQQGLRVGGFGIMLAKGLVDEVIYNEEGNDVLLLKYLDSPSHEPASAVHSQ